MIVPEGFPQPQDPQRAMNGTYAYLYMNGIALAGLENVTTETSISYEPIKQPGQLSSGQKMIEVENTGSMSLVRFDHRLVEEIHQCLASGKQPMFDIVSTIADPNANESRTVQYRNCTIEKLTYLAASHGEILKDEYPFHFEEAIFLN